MFTRMKQASRVLRNLTSQTRASLRTTGRAGFPIFSTTIEANHVAKRTSAATRPSSRMNEEEKRHVLRFARDPNSDERIAASLAPSIYGQKHVKRALAMAMFGGCSKDVDGKHRIRGDVRT
mmetsp:Transcript_7397/g.25246  ORF Transcript_7397/g.25246 Transcript_7397/m.25246 type:complete len:121 (+) Transcript_7397:1075-1437(+)